MNRLWQMEQATYHNKININNLRTTTDKWNH